MTLEEFMTAVIEETKDMDWRLNPLGTLRASRYEESNSTLPTCTMCPLTALVFKRTSKLLPAVDFRKAGTILEIGFRDIDTIIRAADCCHGASPVATEIRRRFLEGLHPKHYGE